MRGAWIVVAAALAFPAAAGAAGSSQIACVGSDDVVYRAKPKDCVLHSRGKPFAGYTQLAVVGITWRNWGTAHPTATATVRANMGYRSKVTLRLSQRVSCNGHLRYKQVVLTYADDGRTGKTQLDTCTD